MKRQWLIRVISLFPILGVIFIFYGSFTLTKLQTKRLEAEFIRDENPLPASVEDLPIKTGEQEIYEFKGLPFEIEHRQAEMDAMRRECGMPPYSIPIVNALKDYSSK